MKRFLRKALIFMLCAVLVGLAGCANGAVAGELSLARVGGADSSQVAVTVSPAEGSARGLTGYEGYTLEKMLVLSRHHIRSPLSGSGSQLDSMTTGTWFDWTSGKSELSLRGGAEETMMGQYYRKYLVGMGLMEENARPEDGKVRIYANSMQRTIATARYFLAGFLPVADIAVEHAAEYDTMDPVFSPVLTRADGDFKARVDRELAEAYPMEVMKAELTDGYALLAKVLDFEHSDYARENGVTAFEVETPVLNLEVGKEPTTAGSLKLACSAADALVLQYYEESDPVKAGFGHTLSFEEWRSLARIVDTYGDMLFSLPSVAIDVAHPLLQEMARELDNRERIFTFLCGHDSNLVSVMSALEVEDYVLPNTVSPTMPIGTQLVLETWKNAQGEAFVSLRLVYQSLDQLRNLQMMSPENPPECVNLALAGLEANEDGLYKLADVQARFQKAIDAYEALDMTDGAA